MNGTGTLNTFFDTFTDIKNGKIVFNSIDDVINLGINSVDDLMKLGVSSVDDLAKLKVSSIDDLAKIGIKNKNDLAKLGIDSSDLKKLGIDCKLLEEVNNSITKSEYTSLRKKTPSNDIRKMVNPEGPKIDPVYGYVTDVLEADHIVQMKEIVNMPGFSQLSKEQQIEILNLKDNFIGLGKSTNASKGAKKLDRMGRIF